MVRHFQMLFDVPRICGVYAKMSDIYRRLKETHNIMLNLKEFLGLGKFFIIMECFLCENDYTV